MTARPSAAPDRGLLWSTEALRLGPRVIRAMPGPQAVLWLVLRPAALPPAERAVLARAERAGLRAAPRPELHPDECLLVLRRFELEDLAARHPAAAMLLASVEARLRPPSRPRLAGIVNVTPDSFSDGGRFLDPQAAVEHGLKLVAEGAELLDVGGESTRPGAEPVSARVECERVVPVIAALAGKVSVPICVDTTKAAVAEAALDAGATIVNDVSAGRFDPDMLPLVARRGCGHVLMHMRGTPGDMQRDPRYDEVVADVLESLRERSAAALDAGVDPDRLWIDPGIGFGKTLEHNLVLLRRLEELRSLGPPLYVGVSRKSFIGQINSAAGLGGEPPRARLGGTSAAVAACVQAGAEILRVHDVAIAGEAARVAWALRTPSGEPSDRDGPERPG